jgi:membrane dipeptidase
MQHTPDILADERGWALHREALVFDGLAIAYVLDERFTQRCLEGGVHAANVTFALEENWDMTLGIFERHLAKID